MLGVRGSKQYYDFIYIFFFKEKKAMKELQMVMLQY